MLHSIFIKDFILIEHLEVDFDKSFIAITGETGAGKSIFVEAMKMLAGSRADSSNVRLGANKAVIEAVFNDLGDSCLEILETEGLISEDAPTECIIRREIHTSGRGRAFVNDTPVNLSLLTELGSSLIDVHSQHQNLLLKESHFQIEVVDSMLASGKSKTEFFELYKEWSKEEKLFQELVKQAEQNATIYDYNVARYRELSSIDMGEETQEALEAEAKELLHSQDIYDVLSNVVNSLSSEEACLSRLHTAVQEIRKAVDYKTGLKEYEERLSSAEIELHDIAQDLEQLIDRLDPNSTRQEYVLEKLNTLNMLYRKYNVADWEQLVLLRSELEHAIKSVENSEEEINTRKERIADLQVRLAKIGTQLTQERKEVAHMIEKKVTENLRQLEMPYAQFRVQIEPSGKATPSGFDKVTFLFSANPEQVPAPMADVASGGEISRLMLSIKSLIKTTHQLPSIIFDEIDTGISGIVANRMGQIMRQMGLGRQIIVITHLPQIAAKASQHFMIYKEQGHSSSTRLKCLDPNERINEIARLQSGENTSDIALAAAAELLRQS